MGVLCWSLLCNALLCVFSNFAIILTRERELVALLWLSSWCLVTVSVPHDAMGLSAMCDCGIS